MPKVDFDNILETLNSESEEKIVSDRDKIKDVTGVSSVDEDQYSDASLLIESDTETDHIQKQKVDMNAVKNIFVVAKGMTKTWLIHISNVVCCKAEIKHIPLNPRSTITEHSLGITSKYPLCCTITESDVRPPKRT
ncbi:hypothetical protein RN001_001686 [Aquatica leii]|uniref:Uncharacterized protein n=1 Tax=Aquatica leii TaxID=1421715 RepID=A0AAN7PBZ4_9COLE|nr:hypothetical protein RN001_001686 [Aquatica leii]